MAVQRSLSVSKVLSSANQTTNSRHLCGKHFISFVHIHGYNCKKNSLNPFSSSREVNAGAWIEILDADTFLLQLPSGIEFEDVTERDDGIVVSCTLYVSHYH